MKHDFRRDEAAPLAAPLAGRGRRLSRRRQRPASGAAKGRATRLTVAPLLLAPLLLAPLVGCDSAPVDAPPRADLVPPSAVEGTGRVAGRVELVGTPPPRPILEDARCFPGAAPVRDDSVVVGDGGGLADVFVSLVPVVPAGTPAVTVDGSTLPPVVLDQKDCRYTPHAVGVVVNQPLRVRNSDPTFHNVHYTPDRNPHQNLAFAEQGEVKAVAFQYPEMIHVRCDVHGWMGAWVGVFPTPHFAVTGTGGGFAIEGVPPGDYTLVAHHAVYGDLRQSVTITEDGDAPGVSLAYRPPGAGT